MEKMDISGRKFLLTGAAVLVYCLVVSFGPGLLLNGTSNADYESSSAQVQIVGQLN
jgi:hypothetical protein